MKKKVIVVKDIPSNILEEAVIVLRDGVNISSKNIYNSSFKYGLAINEAESVIEEFINKGKNEKNNKKNIFEKIFFWLNQS